MLQDLFQNWAIIQLYNFILFFSLENQNQGKKKEFKAVW